MDQIVNIVILGYIVNLIFTIFILIFLFAVAEKLELKNKFILKMQTKEFESNFFVLMIPYSRLLSFAVLLHSFSSVSQENFFEKCKVFFKKYY